MLAVIQAPSHSLSPMSDSDPQEGPSSEETGKAAH